MSEQLSYDEILDKLPAYALGALEPEEMLAVEDYLRNHQELLIRFEESEQAAAQLVHLAPNVPLPAKNKQALMARVQADLTSPDGVPVIANPRSASPISRPQPIEGRSWLTNWWQSLGAGRGWAVATGLAALALLVLSLYTGQMQGRLGQVENEVARLQTTNEELQTTNEQLQQNYQILQQQLETDQQRLAFIANAGPDQTVAVAGTDEAPQANGQLFVGHNNQALLAVHNLPPLPEQQTYQLWLTSENQPVISAGLFRVEGESPSWIPVEIPSAAEDFTIVAVSVEPAEGSAVATGPIVLHTP
jgi:anti-sigma-K factor RskA